MFPGAPYDMHLVMYFLHAEHDERALGKGTLLHNRKPDAVYDIMCRALVKGSCGGCCETVSAVIRDSLRVKAGKKCLSVYSVPQTAQLSVYIHCQSWVIH